MQGMLEVKLVLQVKEQNNMAVNIPQIQRGKGVAQDSIGRVQVDTGAGLNAYLKETEAVGSAVSKVASTYVDYRIKAEEQAIDYKVKDLTTQSKVQMYNKGSEFSKIEKIGEDHTQQYEEALQSLGETKNKFLEGLDPSSKAYERAKSEMNDDIAQVTISLNNEYNRANAIRRAKIDEKELDNIIRYDLKDAVAYANPKDKDGFAAFDKIKEKIKSVVNRSDVASGTAKETPEGQPIYSQTALAKADKLFGNAVQIGIENAAAVGDIPKAKAIFKQYEKDINPEDTKKLNEFFHKADKDKTITDFVYKIAKLPEDVGLEAISANKNIPDKDKSEAVERYGKLKVQIRERENRKSAATKQVLLKQLFTDPDKATYTPQRLQDSPKYSKGYNSLKPEDRRDVDNELGYRPKVGDDTQMQSVTDSYKSGDMKSWKLDDFKRKTVNLNSEQYKAAEKYYASSQGKGAGGPKPEIKNKISNKVLQNLELSGSPIYEYGVSKNGKRYLTDNAKLKNINKIIPYIEEELSKYPDSDLSPSEMASLVQDLSKKVNKEFTPKQKPKEKGFFDGFSLNPFRKKQSLTESEDKEKVKKQYNF